jgi:histidinol dehydrogenase
MRRYTLSELGPQDIERLCRRNPLEDGSILETCRKVFDEVRARGDKAVLEYTRQFDKVELQSLVVKPTEWRKARQTAPSTVVNALQKAASNIRRFHSQQVSQRQEVEVQDGVVCWRESRPIDPVGLYVPAGNAVLPSSVLMLGIPARLAGCHRIVLAAPPRPDGSVAPEVLIAANIAGVRRVVKMGGAQAIAAMTFGTETVPAVNKILGPGNRWVQTAKLLSTFYGVAIDMIAGPSEVLVVADEGASARLVASDLIAQAEHGADSQAVLVSTSEQVIEASLREVEKQLADLPRRGYAESALGGSFAVLAPSLEAAFDFSNRYAPEHLILHLKSPRDWLDAVHAAGSVFLGRWSPEVAGDYASGTNHTLPTSGLARAFSGVSVDSFVKRITFQELTSDGLRGLAPVLQTLASLEGLEGHRRAVATRFQEDKEGKNN